MRMYAARENSFPERWREGGGERESSSSSPRKSVNVGKVRVEGRLNLRVRGRVMGGACTSQESRG